MTFITPGFESRPVPASPLVGGRASALQPQQRPHGRDAPQFAGCRALVLEGDPRTASYVRELLERMQVQVVVARSLLEVGPHVTVPPPQLLVLSLPPRDAMAHIEFAAALRASRRSACVFVIDRLDWATARGLAEIGEKLVLCKPVHREQLEAACVLAMLELEGVKTCDALAVEQMRVRELHLERTLRRIADALAVAGIGPADESIGGVSLPGLRPREAEIVRLLLQHVRVPAIAARLGIKQQTVRNHLKGAFKRTGVRSQQQLLDHFARAARGTAHAGS